MLFLPELLYFAAWIYSNPTADPTERAVRAGRSLQEWRSDEVRYELERGERGD